MMLQVKNCRLFSLLLVLLMTGLMVTSCKKDKDEPTTPTTPGTQSIVGNLPAPSWAVSDEYDMTSSMTVTAKVDLTLTYESQAKAAGWEIAEGDMLAAFDGENCIGLEHPSEGLFYLYVTAPKNGSEVTLKYYSEKLKNIFTAEDKITYINDGTPGTVAEPYTPKWKVGN